MQRPSKRPNIPQKLRQNILKPNNPQGSWVGAGFVMVGAIGVTTGACSGNATGVEPGDGTGKLTGVETGTGTRTGNGTGTGAGAGIG